MTWLVEQHYCEGCGKHVSGGDKCLDHCHVSGRLRGVLCRQCNAAIGCARESARQLRKLSAYLDRYDTDECFDYELVAGV